MSADESKREGAVQAASGEAPREHEGGPRFSRRVLIMVSVGAVVLGVVAAEGIRSAGVKTTSAVTQVVDDGAAAARNQAEVEDLATGSRAPVMPSAAPAAVVPMPSAQMVTAAPPKAPSRYAEWAADKYMKALEAPQMVAAFHGGGTLELGSGRAGQGSTVLAGGGGANVTLHPPASPYTVMTGSVIPAVMVSGINSDLPGPLVAQVSENVFDSATGKSLLIPQGSRLVGVYRNASNYGQQRVQVAFQRLIFPDTSSMDLPQMPGGDQGGYAGVTDQVDNHYLATFGTAALMSLISAGQMVGQMAAFGGGGTYGVNGYYQPNQWAMAGETAGSAASSQLGGVGQQMVGQGMNRPATIEIRPGYEFNVMVTADLVFPGPFKG